VRISKLIALSLWLCLGFLVSGHALTLEYADGTKVEGEIVQGKPEFLKIRVDAGKYVNFNRSGQSGFVQR